MSYRRAWLLIDSLNRNFKHPAVVTQLGGQGGGGAALTEFGIEIIRQYRAIEKEAEAAVAARLRLLEGALVPPGTAER
jgi:molybdate transport system regulatory protein